MALDPMLIIPIATIFLFFMIVAIIFLWNLPAWLRAMTSGVPISVFDILGMRLRRSNVNRIVGALIMAKGGGVDIPCRQMEWAYLQGVDLEKVTLAAIQVKKRGLGLTFKELVDAEMQQRLGEKLK